MRSHTRSKARGFGWLTSLTRLTLAALLTLQWLALVHAVSHVGPATGTQIGFSSAAQTWGHDAGDGVCQALDHFCHSDVLLHQAAPAAVAAPHESLAQPAPESAGSAPRWSRCARGPPVLS